MEGEAVRLPDAFYRAGRGNQHRHALLLGGSRCWCAESGEEGAEWVEDPGAGAVIQEGHRRPARVPVANHYRVAAKARGRRQLQRSVLPHGGTWPEIRLEHGLRAAGEPWPVRL